MRWLLIGWVWAQQVEILHSEALEGVEGGKRLSGNVHLRHDTLELFCDTAYQQANGLFIATGNLRMYIGTQGTLRAQNLSYDPITKVAELWGAVQVNYGKMRLFTPHLVYDRVANVVTYKQGGRLVSSRGEIRSQKAEAHLDRQEVLFRQEVQLRRGNYTLSCDSLLYAVADRLGILLSEGIARGRGDTVWASRGYWDDSCRVGYFYGGVRYGDTVWYGGGEQAWWHADQESLFVVCEVWLRARQRREGCAADTLLHGQRLSLVGNVTLTSFDSETLFVQAQRADLQNALYLAQGEVEFYRQGLWGKGEALYYDTLKKVFRLSTSAWTCYDKVQLWADTIWFFQGQERDSAVAIGKTFLASQADTIGRFFHQIQADKIISQIIRSKLRRLWAYGQVESFYYYKEDTTWRGGNWAQGPMLRVEMDSLGQKPIFIGYYGKTRGYFVPSENLTQAPYYGRRFRWAGRPSPPWDKRD
ncbi:MAG: OstA-like protein [Bacteroidia bacterium]